MSKVTVADARLARILKAVEEILDDPKEMSIMMQASTEEDPTQITAEEEVLYSEEDFEDYLDSELDEELKDIEVASEVKPGIEDTIGDDVSGGDRTVSVDPIIDGFGDDAEIESDEIKDIVPAIARNIRSLVARLDRAAARYEAAGNIAFATQIDTVADRLEEEFLNDGE